MLPSNRKPGRLVQRSVGNGMGTVTVNRGNTKLSATFSCRNRRLPPGDKDYERWRSDVQAFIATHSYHRPVRPRGKAQLGALGIVHHLS